MTELAQMQRMETCVVIAMIHGSSVSEQIEITTAIKAGRGYDRSHDDHAEGSDRDNAAHSISAF